MCLEGGEEDIATMVTGKRQGEKMGGGRKRRKVESGVGGVWGEDVLDQQVTDFLASGKVTSVATKQTSLKVLSGVEWYATKVVREIVEWSVELSEVMREAKLMEPWFEESTGVEKGGAGVVGSGVQEENVKKRQSVKELNKILDILDRRREKLSLSFAKKCLQNEKSKICSHLKNQNTK